MGLFDRIKRAFTGEDEVIKHEETNCLLYTSNAKELLQISNAIKQENDTRAEGERK